MNQAGFCGFYKLLICIAFIKPKQNLWKPLHVFLNGVLSIGTYAVLEFMMKAEVP